MEQATPGTLGAIRAWLAGILLLSTMWEDLPSTALLPRSMFDPATLGALQFLTQIPGFDSLLTNSTALAWLQGSTGVLLFLAMVGLKTRWVVPLGALAYLTMAGLFRSYSWFYHTGLIPAYGLLILSLTPCADGWSLDRLIRIGQGKSVVEPNRGGSVYGWSRTFVWIVIAIPYFLAGLSKIRNGGWEWWQASSVKGHLLNTTLNPMQFDFTATLRLMQGPDWLFSALGFLAVFGELLFGLVLVWKLARYVAPMLMGAMHVGTLFLQNILFFDLILLQVVFYDTARLRGWAARYLGRMDVLFDGNCPLCQRTRRVLESVDILGRLRFVNFRKLDRAEYNERHQLKLSLNEMEQSMWVVDDKAARSGFQGYRRMAQAIPLGWVLLPFLYVPGLSHLGAWIYDRIASRRTILSCDASCPHDFGPPPSFQRPPVSWPAPALAVAMVVFLMGCWQLHVEHYPFTSMGMFSWKIDPPEVKYVKAYALYNTGEEERAPFEQWIGAMGDSRYRQVLMRSFSSREGKQRCRDFLEACRDLPSESAARSVTGFRLELWSWNYEIDAQNPDHGNILVAQHFQ